MGSGGGLEASRPGEQWCQSRGVSTCGGHRRMRVRSICEGGCEVALSPTGKAVRKHLEAWSVLQG